MEINGNGWESWGKYVLKELERQESCDVDQDKRISKNSIDIAMLKVKCSLLGLAAGSLPLMVVKLIEAIKK